MLKIPRAPPFCPRDIRARGSHQNIGRLSVLLLVVQHALARERRHVVWQHDHSFREVTCQPRAGTGVYVGVKSRVVIDICLL